MPYHTSFNSRLTSWIFCLFLIFFLCFVSAVMAQQVQDFTNLGLYGGRINAIAVDPSNPDRVFAGTYQGDGVYRSDDGGASWTPVIVNGVPVNEGEDEFVNQSIFDIEIAPSDPNVVWVAHNQWVEKSTDGGATWTHIYNSDMQSDCQPGTGCFRFCQAIAIDPVNPNVVYVGAAGPASTYVGGAVYKTTDGGATWTKLAAPAGGDFDFAVKDIDIHPRDTTDPNDDVVWIVTSSEGFAPYQNGWDGTLYRSGDSGATWNAILAMTPYWGAFGTVAADPRDANRVFTGSSSLGLGIVTVDAAGAPLPIPGPGLEQPCTRVDPNTGLAFPDNCVLVNDIAFGPAPDYKAYAVWLYPSAWWGDGIGKVGVFTRDEGNQTWTREDHALGTSPTDTLSFNQIAVRPDVAGALIAGEFNQGIFRTTDLNQPWTPSTVGISAVTVYDVATDPRNRSHLLAGAFSGIYERTNGGPWVLLDRQPAHSVAFHPTDAATYFGGLEGLLSRTTDGGQTWSYATVEGPIDPNFGAPDTYNYVSDIAFDPVDPATMYLAVNGFSRYGRVQKSSDGGVTLATVHEQSSAFNAVAVDPADAAHVYAGGGNFYAPALPGSVWESTDAGLSWLETGLTNVVVNDILIDPADPTVLYAGAGWSGGTDVPLWKSVDGGTSWAQAFTGIPIDLSTPLANAVTDLAFYNGTSDVIYGATLGEGIFVTPNGATAWVNLGTPRFNVFAIATGSLYAATEGGLLQLTGTGLIYGTVSNAQTATPIDGAMVSTDLGHTNMTINGEYMIVAPAGIFDVTAAASSFSDLTMPNVLVAGADVANVDFPMNPGTGSQTLLAAPVLLFPENGAVVGGSDIEFKWQVRQAEGVRQYLQYDTDIYAPGHQRHAPIPIASVVKTGAFYAGSGSAALFFGLAFFGQIDGRRRRILLLALLAALLVAGVSCGGNGSVISSDSSTVITHRVSGLSPGETYYWQVSLDNGAGSTSASEVRSFSVQ